MGEFEDRLDNPEATPEEEKEKEGQVAEGTEQEEVPEPQPEEGQEEKGFDLEEFLKDTPFKDPEAFKRSYKELLSYKTKLEQESKKNKEALKIYTEELSKLKNELERLKFQRELDLDDEKFKPLFAKKPFTIIDQIIEARVKKAVESIKKEMKAKEAKIKASQKVQEFLAAHPEDGSKALPYIYEIIANDPALRASPNALEYAYAKWKVQNASQAVQEKIEKKIRKQLEKEKEGFVEGASKTPTSKKQTVEEEYKKAILSIKDKTRLD